MEVRDLIPMTGVRGIVDLPGSKSISVRTLLLSALADGVTRIKRLLTSDDVKYTLDALTALNVSWHREENGDVIVHGLNGFFRTKQANLFLGNSGLAFRSLTAILALSNGEFFLDGVSRMYERPISDLVDALNDINAKVEYVINEKQPPLRIHPANIDLTKGIAIRGDVSSQFLTGLLIALPLMKQELTINVIGELISKPYVEMTIKMMKMFGVNVERNSNWTRFHIEAGQGYTSPSVINVEGDASSASYFLAAGAIGGGPVRVEGVGQKSIQGDVEFVQLLGSMGVSFELGDDSITTSNDGILRGIDCDANDIPDAAMTLAIVALFCEGETTLRNIGSWRVKECDRLAAMANELRKLGAIVEEGSDYLRISPPNCCTPNVTIHSYDDHRIAMCFSLVSVAGIPVRIDLAECVTKTFPNFFKTLESIRRT